MPSAPERSPKALLILILALLGGSLLVHPRSETPTSTAPGDRAASSPERRHRDTTPSEQDTAAQRRLRAPLADFLGVPLTESDEKSQLAALKQACSDNGVGVEFIIACMPDPIDAVLGYRFDSLLDSVQRAVSTDHYVPDRYYFPWPLAGDRQGARGDEPDSQRFPHEPGVLLFRRPPNEEGGWQDLLIIYLVGETSIYGIQKESFQRAVSEIETLGELPGVPGVDEAKIRVLGPCFSGSAASLKVAIERSPAAKEHFRIVSGMVLNLDPKDLPKPFLTTTVHIEYLPAPHRIC